MAAFQGELLALLLDFVVEKAALAEDLPIRGETEQGGLRKKQLFRGAIHGSGEETDRIYTFYRFGFVCQGLVFEDFVDFVDGKASVWVVAEHADE